MKKSQTILFISPSPSSFVLRDILFLRRYFNVEYVPEKWNPKWLIPFMMIRQLFQLAFTIRRYRCLIIMFGGYWSAIPVFMGRFTSTPVYIIAGGSDCVSFPDVNYGSFRKPLLSAFVRFSLNHCTVIVPVAETLIESRYTYYPAVYLRQGIKSFIPGIKTPFHIIHNGFDVGFWSKSRVDETNRSGFIIVAPINSKARMLVKGVDLIVEVATEFPQSVFTIIGIMIENLEISQPLPPNVRTLPFLPQEVVRKHFVCHDIYLQLSLHEGFPNSLCEAMLCGCIPIVSDVGINKEIIGSTGLVLRKRDPDRLINLMRLALELPNKKKWRERARQKVIHHYPIHKRIGEFVELINGKEKLLPLEGKDKSKVRSINMGISLLDSK